MSNAVVDVIVSEVGPRDGLQSVKRAMPTPVKLRWVKALSEAGLREIEVGSFVSPKLLPQMADAEDVVRAAIQIPNLNVIALCPNLKGAERAIASGVHAITMPVSASREHSMANIRMTPEQAIEQVRQVRGLCETQPTEKRPRLEVGLSTAFGCSIQGN